MGKALTKSSECSFIVVALFVVGLAGCVKPPASSKLPALAPPSAPLSQITERLQLGKSVEGRPIWMHVFGSRGPTIFIFAGIHGDEPKSKHVALQLVDYLSTHREIYTTCRVAVVPAANPDGLLRGTRVNARGVDCNRNFPAENWKLVSQTAGSHGGQTPASEPETQAILKAVEMLKPERIISIHSALGVAPCNNYDGPGKALAELMGQYNGYAATDYIGYPTSGSFGSWAGVDRNIPTITLELPGRQSSQKVWQDNREAILAYIRFGLPVTAADSSD